MELSFPSYLSHPFQCDWLIQGIQSKKGHNTVLLFHVFLRTLLPSFCTGSKVWFKKKNDGLWGGGLSVHPPTHTHTLIQLQTQHTYTVHLFVFTLSLTKLPHNHEFSGILCLLGIANWGIQEWWAHMLQVFFRSWACSIVSQDFIYKTQIQR